MEDVLVSVIIPLYNSEKYINSCLDSILEQTLHQIEIIIVDDCSSDNSLNIIKEYDDPRLIILENKTNLGVTQTINKALRLAKGKYIARMDADDIAFNNRLQIQKDYMERNLDIDILATQVIYMDERKKKLSYKYKELKDSNLKGVMITYNPIIHPTVMMRNNKKTLFNEKVNVSQDYLKWLESINDFNFETLRVPLLYYRISDGSVTFKNKESKLERHIDLLNYFNNINNINISQAETRNYVISIHHPKSNCISLRKLDLTFKKYQSFFNQNINSSSIIKYRFGYIWIKVALSKKQIKGIFSLWLIKGVGYCIYRLIKELNSKLFLMKHKNVLIKSYPGEIIDRNFDLL